MNPEIYREVILRSMQTDSFEPAPDCDTYGYCQLGKHCQDAARIASDLPPNLGNLSSAAAEGCQTILNRSCCSHSQVGEVKQLAAEKMTSIKDPVNPQ